MSNELEMRVKKLEANQAVLQGRLDGMHMLLLVVARALPPDVAAVCEDQARQAAEKVNADLLAMPVPDAMLAEMQRVMEQGIHVLSCAAKSS